MKWQTREGITVYYLARGFRLTATGRELMACWYILDDCKKLDYWCVSGHYRADRRDHPFDLVELIADNTDAIHQWKRRE